MKRSIISVFDKTELTTGAHKRHIGLLKELKERGYTIYFFSPVNFLDQTDNYFEIPAHKEHIVPKSIQTWLNVKKKFKQVREALRDIDVILAFGFNHIYASLYLKRKLDLPLVFALRSNTYESRSIAFDKEEKGLLKKFFNQFKKHAYLILFKLVEMFVYRRADQIVVQNNEDSSRLVKVYRIEQDKVNIIPNNINFFDHDCSIRNTSSSLESVIFVGSLSKRKGIKYLLRAIRDLHNEGIDIQLNILGDGELRDDLQEFVKRYDLEEVVTLHGFLEDPLKYIASSDLVVLPSLSDSFPNTVLEALQLDTPVIGSNVGGIAEMLKYGSLLFPPEDSDSIRNKIKLLLDPSEYKKVKEKCMDRKRKFIFDWTGLFENQIEKTINNKN